MKMWLLVVGIFGDDTTMEGNEKGFKIKKGEIPICTVYVVGSVGDGKRYGDGDRNRSTYMDFGEGFLQISVSFQHLPLDNSPAMS
jgi:hypothetical protein